MGELRFGFSFAQTDWINQVYLPENHARLKAAHAYVSGELRGLGIPFLNRGAGFFIWADLRKVMQAGRGHKPPSIRARRGQSPPHPEPLHLPSQHLPKATFEEERLLWRRFLDNKVLVSFGEAFECKEPGWFRLVFSDKAHRLRLGEQSALRAPLLTVSFLPACLLPASRLTQWPEPFLPTHPPTHPASQPSVLTGPSLTLLRNAEGPEGAHGRAPDARRPPFLSDPGANGPAQLSWPLPCGQYCPPEVLRASKTGCG